MFLLCQSLWGHWQTATKVTQGIDSAQRHRGRPEPHEGRANNILYIVDFKVDLVADHVQVGFHVDITRQWLDFVAIHICICHADTIAMPALRYKVASAEHAASLFIGVVNDMWHRGTIHRI